MAKILLSRRLLCRQTLLLMFDAAVARVDPGFARHWIETLDVPRLEQSPMLQC